MNRIQLVGQVITSTNYATRGLFRFTAGPLRAAAESFLACGVTDVEIPQAVLDPERRCPDTGVDEDALGKTLAALPTETRVIASYLGSTDLDDSNEAYLDAQKRNLARLTEAFPHMQYAMLHPAAEDNGPESIRRIVETYGRLAEYAASLRKGFQLCFHNHYDTNAETAEQVRTYLAAIEAANLSSLRWGPDTGHCHGMGEESLDVLREYVHLIGDYVHIKARVPAFDSLHGGAEYNPQRDIWKNPAEKGRGLYSGFVNVADPEITTPLADVFEIIRGGARPANGVMHGAIEIDIPRQHPQLEALCAVLYLKNMHGAETGMPLSNDEIIARVFQECE